MKRIVTHRLVATSLAIGAVGVAQAHSDLHIGVSLGTRLYVAPVYVRPAAPVYREPWRHDAPRWHDDYRHDYAVAGITRATTTLSQRLRPSRITRRSEANWATLKRAAQFTVAILRWACRVSTDSCSCCRRARV